MTNQKSNTVNLITGGAGFLGSHLIDKLMEKGEEVICVDNFFTGTKNLIQWLGNSSFELIRHDITKPITLEVDKIGTWLVLHHQFTISLIQLKRLKRVSLEPTTCWEWLKEWAQNFFWPVQVKYMEIQKYTHNQKVTEAINPIE